MTAIDCGAAALAMVLAYHGRRVPLEELRRALQPGRAGASAAALVEVGAAYGLRGRTVSIDIEDLQALSPGTILHWEFRHFVVFERFSQRTVDIADPASGHRSVPLAAFRRAFTGVAILLEPSEPFARGDTRRTHLPALFSQVFEHRSTIAKLIGVTALVQLLTAALPLATGVLIDRVVPQKDYSFLLVLTLAYSGLQLLNTLAGFIREHLAVYLRTRLEASFTLRFVDHLIDLPYEFFQQRTSGDLMMRLGSNSAVRDILTSTVLSTLLDGMMATVFLVLLMMFSLPLTLIVVVLAGARLAVLAIMRARQRRLLAESVENQARSQTAQVELLSGMETLKALGVERRAAEAWSNVFISGLNIVARRGRIDAVFNLLLSVLSGVSTLMLLFYGAYLVLEGVWTLGNLMAFNALAAGFLGPLNTLMTSALRLQMLEVYLERLNDVWETAPEQTDTVEVPPEPLTGAIALDKVSFRYSAEGNWVLQDLSVTIAAGARVAIVGRTGSGKSSLARLLAGLYLPNTGRILFDGRDFRTLERRWVRRQMGIVTQDAHLFGRSIRDNIALADPEMGLDRVMRAAKLACIHDEIAAMPLGYSTMIADRGLSLSGGQRQRIAIARAVAAEPTVLILDEATSHLDAATEQRLNANLAALRCTTIIISHKLSSVFDADLIVLVENGRIVEAGRHEQMMARGGYYAELVAAHERTSTPHHGRGVGIA